MKLTPTVAKSLMPTILFTISNFGAAAAMTTKDRMRGRAAAGDPLPVPVEEIVELCPNPDFQPIDENIPCLNYTDPATPKGYGQRDTCISLEGSPLHVGSPQGVSSVRVYGTLNCTLYKTIDCEPDAPFNGHIISGTGESRLYGGAGPDDPEAIDDKAVAFRCRRPGVPPAQQYGHPANASLAKWH